MTIPERVREYQKIVDLLEETISIAEKLGYDFYKVNELYRAQSYAILGRNDCETTIKLKKAKPEVEG